MPTLPYVVFRPPKADSSGATGSCCFERHRLLLERCEAILLVAKTYQQEYHLPISRQFRLRAALDRREEAKHAFTSPHPEKGLQPLPGKIQTPRPGGTHKWPLHQLARRF